MNKRQGEIDVPATKVELEHGINPGLFMGIILNGLVPSFEEHTVRLERGFRLSEWEQISEEEKAIMIAQSRIYKAVHNLTEEAEIEEIERKQHAKGIKT